MRNPLRLLALPALCALAACNSATSQAPTSSAPTTTVSPRVTIANGVGFGTYKVHLEAAVDGQPIHTADAFGTSGAMIPGVPVGKSLSVSATGYDSYTDPLDGLVEIERWTASGTIDAVTATSTVELTPVTGFLNALDQDGTIYFHAPAAGSNQMTRLYGADSYADSRSQVSDLSVTEPGVLALSMAWADPEKAWSCFGGFVILWKNEIRRDFSGVSAIRFEYRTTGNVKDVHFAPVSELNAGWKSGIERIAVLPPSTGFRQVTIDPAADLKPQTWMPSTPKTWDEVKPSIHHLKFTINANVDDAVGLSVIGDTAGSIEIRNLRLVPVDGSTFPLPAAP